MKGETKPKTNPRIKTGAKSYTKTNQPTKKTKKKK